MSWFGRLQDFWRSRRTQPPTPPAHLDLGRLGEEAARRELVRGGMKFLLANFRSRHGEIDLILRDADCLVFVEVKTRSSEEWVRPAAAVNAAKRRRLSLTAEDYLRRLEKRRVKSRFDVVEVLVGGGSITAIRHLVNAFPWDPRRPRRR